MRQVFLSSTARDLQEYRDAVFDAIQKLDGWRVVRMEDFGARADMTDEFCRAKVAGCDLFVGITGHYFGSNPKNSKKSYTQQEYDTAIEINKPCLMFVTPNDFPLPANLTEDDEKRETQKEFRARVMARQPCAFFTSEQELANKVVTAIYNYEITPNFSVEEKHYLDALAHTKLLELAGILDSGEQEPPKPQEIFVMLSVAEEVEERDERQPKDKRERERPITITRRVTIEQALREHRNLMILGDPGAGKSTLLRYLTLVAALSLRATEESEAIPNSQLEIASSQKPLLAMTEAKSPLPILIRLSSFARSGQSFVEYFDTYAEKQLGVSLGKKFFERALEDGQAVVCLDGLDEVSQPAQRIEVRNAITALANRYPRNRFIVTARVAGYDSASLDKRAFAHHTIVPFGEKEIQAFVEKWYAAREREPEQAKTRAANLFNDLKANERLLKLAENPLTLTIIALVHQRAQGKLPDARVELYDRCAETLIEEWDKWRGLEPEDEEKRRPYYRLRRRLLERAAYWMHVESGRGGVTPPQHTKRALEMKVAEFLVEDKTLNLSEDTARIEAKQFVALATSRTGILVEREQGAVSFIHLTFQEYFAASDLYWRYRKTPDALWQAIQPHLYDSRWLEVILLLLGRLNDDGDTPSIIVEKILREHDKFDDVIHRDLFLAARCLADGVKVCEPLQNEIVDTLLEFASAKRPKYDYLPDDSIQALGDLRGNVQAGNGLLALAQDAQMDAWERLYAAQALGQLGRTDNAARVLLALVQEVKVDELVRDAVAEALGKLGRADDAVIHRLLTLAQDKKVDVWARRAAAEALGKLGRADDTVIHCLLALAQDEEVWVGVRHPATEALGKLGRADDTVIHCLLTLAQDEKVDSDVRRAAAEALGKLGRADDTVIHCLLKLAQDVKMDERVRYAAAGALGELGRTDDAARVLSVLAQDVKVDEWVRYAAAEALGELGRADDAARVLLALMQEVKVNEFERYAVAGALGKLGRADDAVIQGLLALAQDRKADWDVRRAAAEALGKAGALGKLGRVDDVARVLLALAQNERVHPWVCRSAAEALGKLGRADDAVIQGLLALAQDKKADWDVRRAAAEALGKLGRADDAVIRGLLALVQDKKVEGFVRSVAAQAVGKLGKQEPRVALALLGLSRNRNGNLRDAAYKALTGVVGNLRYAEIETRKIGESWWERVMSRLLAPLGMTK